MSTIVLNPKSISKLANNYIIINGATYNKYQHHLDNILKKAYDLNIKSWNLKYIDDTITDEQKETFYKVDFKGKEKFNNICEVLKVLQKLNYNISVEAVQDRDETITLGIIGDIIECIKNKIISELEDYNNINYGDI
jgi:MoaA/NifB/PqqE/SkfB family radical SAM enzyme